MSNSAAASGTQKTLATRPCQKFQGHSEWVTGVIHLLDGQRIMTCSFDYSLRVWNLKTGEQIRDACPDEESRVSAIALSLDGRKVVCGCWDATVKLWDVDTGKFITEWKGHTEYVRSVCWNRDNGRVVSASMDGTAVVWDVESGKTVLVIETGLSDIRAVIYSPDMTMIATGGNSEDSKEFIKIWDAKTGKLITNLKGHTWQVYCLAWTADGSTLVSGSYDHSIRTWNTTTWQHSSVLAGHTNAVRGIAISPNGSLLASASWDSTAQLWNLENGLPIGLPLQHPNAVESLECVSFSTDGQSLATGSCDHNAYSWDISGIIEEGGLLNPSDCNKSLIDCDATRRPRYRRRDVHRVPPRFFDDAPHHPHPSRTHYISPSSARQYNITGHPSSHGRAHFGRLSSLFQRNNYNSRDAPFRSSLLEWARSTSFRLPRRRDNDNEDIRLQAHLPAVVDVPVAKGKRRNISGAEKRLEKEKAKKGKKASASKPRPPQGSVAQQSGEGALAQPSAEPHADVSASSTPPVIAGTSAVISTSLPDVVIPRAGRWTRFWLFIGCIPVSSDGR